MATLFSDNFNRADSTNLGANWVEQDNWQILSNQLRGSDDGIGAFVETTTTAHAAVADQKVSAKFITAAVDYRITARITSSFSTYYMLVKQGTDVDYDFYRVVSGTSTFIGTRADSFTAGDIIKLEVEGTAQRLYRNGTQLGAAFGDTNISGAGQAGLALGVSELNRDFDDFRVENFAADGTTFIGWFGAGWW